jgi:hypothetical protein
VHGQHATITHSKEIIMNQEKHLQSLRRKCLELSGDADMRALSKTLVTVADATEQAAGVQPQFLRRLDQLAQQYAEAYAAHQYAALEADGVFLDGKGGTRYTFPSFGSFAQAAYATREYAGDESFQQWLLVDGNQELAELESMGAGKCEWRPGTPEWRWK